MLLVYRMIITVDLCSASESKSPSVLTYPVSIYTFIPGGCCVYGVEICSAFPLPLLYVSLFEFLGTIAEDWDAKT